MSTVNRKLQYRQIAFLQGHHFIIFGATNTGKLALLNKLIDEVCHTDKTRIIRSVSDTPGTEEKA